VEIIRTRRRNERVSERRIRLEVPRHAGDELLDVRGPSAPARPPEGGELACGIVNYILSEDIDGTLKKIQSSGGAVVMPKAEISRDGLVCSVPGPDRNYASPCTRRSATAGGPRAVPATCTKSARSPPPRAGSAADAPAEYWADRPFSRAPRGRDHRARHISASSEQRNVTTSATSLRRSVWSRGPWASMIDRFER